MAERTPRTRASLWPAALLAIAAVVSAIVGMPGAWSALSQQVANSTNSASSGIFTSCTSVVSSSSGTQSFFTYPLTDTAGPTAIDVSGNSRSGRYSSAGVTYSQPGPCPRDGAKAVTLNGSSGYVSYTTQVTNVPSAYSEEIWFKTSVGGGLLIGLGSAATGPSSQYDRQVFMTNSGNVAFGLRGFLGLSYTTITSPGTYADGKWHNMIATLGPSGATVGMRLYVDGSLVASNTNTTGAQLSSGFWRIGYDAIGALLSGAPTNTYFTGSLGFASVYTFTMTQAQVTTHYQAGV